MPTESEQKRYLRATERLAEAEAALERYAAKLALYAGKFRDARKVAKAARDLLAQLEEENAKEEVLPCCGEFGTGSGDHSEDCPEGGKP